MEFQDVFADDMNVGGPESEFRVASFEFRVEGGKSYQHGRIAVRGGDGDVVDQRIEPDIGDVVPVERQRNAPIQARGGPRDAEVFERVVLQKAEHFVAAIVGLERNPDAFRM